MMRYIYEGKGAGRGIFLVLLLALSLALAGCTTAGPFLPSTVQPGGPSGGTYTSNGQQIYFTATDQQGTPITFTMPNGGVAGGMMGGMMGGGHLACVNCHGPDGRGGQVSMMMATFQAPDIRYSTLTGGEMHHEEGEEDHPPYTDETIKRAITQGVDPAGNPLAWPMPRWQMSDQDLNDLVAFLKTLD